MRLLSLGHPAARDIERYVDAGHGDAPVDARAERARVAEHLVRCAECRAAVAFRRDLRAAARALPAPEPSPALLARVLAERAAGERGILPNVPGADVAPGRVWPRGRLALGGAMAAAVVVAVAVRQRGAGTVRDTARDTTPVVADTATRADEWFVSPGFFTSVAGAQTPPREPAPPAVRDVDGTRLRPRLVAYAARWTDAAGRVRDDGRGVIALDSVRLDGRAAWRLDERWTGRTGDHGERAEVETLYVARADLRPIERRVHVSPYLRYRSIDVAQRFVGDSVVGRMRAEASDGRAVERPVARRLPDGPYLTDVLAPLFLAAVRLAPGWSGGATSVGWAVVPNDVSYAVALRVVGEERVTVAAGAFDCWRLVVTAPGRRLDYWVRKSDGLAVRARDAAPRVSGAERGVRSVDLASEQAR